MRRWTYYSFRFAKGFYLGRRTDSLWSGYPSSLTIQHSCFEVDYVAYLINSVCGANKPTTTGSYAILMSLSVNGEGIRTFPLVIKPGNKRSFHGWHIYRCFVPYGILTPPQAGGGLKGMIYNLTEPREVRSQ